MRWASRPGAGRSGGLRYLAVAYFTGDGWTGRFCRSDILTGDQTRSRALPSRRLRSVAVTVLLVLDSLAARTPDL